MTAPYDYTQDENYTGPTVEVEQWTQPALTPELEPGEPEPRVASAAEVRDWAVAHHMKVGTRGRIPAEIKAAFTSATGIRVK